jgi:hypothetical protein
LAGLLVLGIGPACSLLISPSEIDDTKCDPANVKAFPTAEGFGAKTPGGRGGQVVPVTTLADSGAGSLRQCIETKGPRTCVFRVGGTITVLSRMKIREPFVTIAGQTAPGDGVTLRGSTDDDGSVLIIQTHDVVIRHLRIRRGPSSPDACCADALLIDGSAGADVHDIMLDHLSISWGVDENLSTYGEVHDITVQWCLIAEGLHDSTNSAGPHSHGVQLGSSTTRSTRISFHHNLLVHNVSSNPELEECGDVDLVNNVVHNPGQVDTITMDRGSSSTPARINVVGNVLLAGPDTPAGVEHVVVNEVTSSGQLQLYVEDNLSPRRNASDPEELAVEQKGRSLLVKARHSMPQVTTTSAAKARLEVPKRAGARRPGLDAVDRRLVDNLLKGDGAIINDPKDVGGWPTLAQGTPPADGDGDGMPDAWEQDHGLDPTQAADGTADADNDGYTNFEEFLNETDPRSCQ